MGVAGGNARLQAAAVCRAAGEPLTIEEIVVDPPKPYEIRIKIICTSLCHTGITFWKAKIVTWFINSWHFIIDPDKDKDK
ncbi:hypothetical protein U9M48_006815 [Paspalum notatum var. saurae]|uniref:Uncharacterized protein n=1 Tax=Paspalum notatum var. saurae TaxID=547442 RepID=A0AAQ3SGI4_PASNO